MHANVTLSVEGALLQEAKTKARRENMTLNDLFRHWLNRYINSSTKSIDSIAGEFDTFMERVKYATPGKHFTRDEMNAR